MLREVRDFLQLVVVDVDVVKKQQLLKMKTMTGWKHLSEEHQVKQKQKHWLEMVLELCCCWSIQVVVVVVSLKNLDYDVPFGS